MIGQDSEVRGRMKTNPLIMGGRHLSSQSVPPFASSSGWLVRRRHVCGERRRGKRWSGTVEGSLDLDEKSESHVGVELEQMNGERFELTFFIFKKNEES